MEKTSAQDRPSKRQRTLQQQKEEEAALIAAQDTSKFADQDGAQLSVLPPPINDDIVPPPPDTESVLLPPPPPPPSSPPPAQPDEDDLPPPPPPPPLLDQDAQDDDITGADYWARLAAEEHHDRTQNTQDLYLDTITRPTLDFDFEKLCSVSLSNINVYACLVCGKYYQGRGKNSYAYFHSIDEGHRVFMNLSTAEVYILPDNYRVESPSLFDIQFLLNPTFSPKQIAQLDAPDSRPSLDLEAKLYLPGFIGLNNIGKTDYMNVIIQALSHVKPLRDFFIRGGPKMPGVSHLKSSEIRNAPVSAAEASGGLASSTELVRRFAALIRKIWNSKAFKGQVSPHEFVQEVARLSAGKFKLTEQADPVEFLGWLLNRVHLDLTGGKRKRESIISRCFQGEVKIESQKVIVRSGIEDELLNDGINDPNNEAIDKLDHDGRKEGGQQDEFGNVKFNVDKEIQTSTSPFLLLAIDLPPPPVFQDAVEKNIIPQVTIASVLAKYDGQTFQETNGVIRRFKVQRLPPYVILHFRRFIKNRFVEERNPTIVNFPVKGLDLSEYVVDPASVPISCYYDLVCNITHEAAAGTVRENTVWRSQVHTRTDGEPIKKQDDGHPKAAQEKWFQTQDLIVEELNKQMIFLGETYIQIWERRGGVEEVERDMTRAAASVGKKSNIAPTKGGVS